MNQTDVTFFFESQIKSLKNNNLELASNYYHKCNIKIGFFTLVNLMVANLSKVKKYFTLKVFFKSVGSYILSTIFLIFKNIFHKIKIPKLAFSLINFKIVILTFEYLVDRIGLKIYF